MNTVRKLNDQDWPAFHIMAKQLTQSLFMNWSEKQILDCWGKNEIWGLFHQEELTSALCVLRSDQDFEILWIQTLSRFLRRGMGAQLLGEWLLFASQQGRFVFLEVHEKNQAALALYLGVGFTKLGVRKNYYSDGAHAISLQFDLAQVKSPS